MQRLSWIAHTWRLAMLGALAAIWLTLSLLLAASGGDPETMLRTLFARHSRADAFKDLNVILALFWAAHSAASLLAGAAARSRRPDVLTVLLIGPAIVVAINLLEVDWSDPNWFVIVAVCTIGWAVSILVSGFYWLSKPVAQDSAGAAADLGRVL